MEADVSDGVHVAAAFLDALDEYAQTVHVATQEAVTNAATRLQMELAEQARSNPRWQNLAEHIEVWSEDGRLIVGVQNPEMMDEAMAAEYGDADHAPVALMRNAGAAARRVSTMQETMSRTFGPVGIPT